MSNIEAQMYIEQIIRIVKDCEEVQQEEYVSAFHKEIEKKKAYDHIVAILRSQL